MYKVQVKVKVVFVSPYFFRKLLRGGPPAIGSKEGHTRWWERGRGEPIRYSRYSIIPLRAGAYIEPKNAILFSISSLPPVFKI
jgi:hypothetical protein